MYLQTPFELDRLANYISRFIAIVGRERWFRRADQLDVEQRKSPYLQKIVADYHWLEMAISYQADVLTKEGRLIPELTTALILAALNFAAVAVEIHAQLSPKGKQVLEGRLRDALKADTGFAPLYSEFDIAQRLMDGGYDVQFVDMEGLARFDLVFKRGAFVGEVECKSISVDAGRQIHRKDFYRFMDSIAPALARRVELRRQEVLLITLEARLSPNTLLQAKLLRATVSMLLGGAPTMVDGPGFKLEIKPYADLFAGAPMHEKKAFQEACELALGAHTHVAGELSEQGGCLIAMRSQRDDDTSKPMLEAMRKAASQFSGERPAFIAIQEHGIEAPDLMLPHVRRRTAILSYALFGHYGAAHVNATYVTGFGAIVVRDGQVGTPAFTVPNPQPTFPISAAEAALFLESLSDTDYANAIGAPLPAPNISFLEIETPGDGTI